jgi:hypothetical protein
MRRFQKWENNLEKESAPLQQKKVEVDRVEYRASDKLEKKIACTAFVEQRQVSKDYFKRIQQAPFGIGNSFEDLKTNNVISTVQRENVWHPYYESNIEEMDFKEKMMAAAEEKRMANLGGSAVTELQS